MGEAAVTYDPVGQERQRIGYSHLIIAMESDLVNDESSFVAVESQLEVKLCFHPWKAKQCGKGRGHVGWQWVQKHHLLTALRHDCGHFGCRGVFISD